MRAAAHPTLLFPEELADPGIRIPQLMQAAESRAVSGGSKGKVRSWMEETSLCAGTAPPTSPDSQNPHEPLAEGRCEQAGGTRPLLQSP